MITTPVPADSGPQVDTSQRARAKGSGGRLGRHIVVRLLLIIPTVFILVSMVFLLMHMIGDPITAALGGRLTPDQLQERIHAAGYDRNIFIQYFEYLGQVATGNFGTTISDNRQISEILLTYGGATLELAFYALIVAFIVGIPLGVLVMVGFFRALPRDLEEAARIDGASHFQIFTRIMLPLTRPALAAVIILNGVWMWNDFFLGLILLTRQDAYTLPVAIMAFRGSYSTEWGLIFASVIISVLPVLIGYVLLSRQFIAGLTAGSVKG